VSNPAPPTSTDPYRRALLRQERSVNTRKALVRAARKLWAEKDYSDTTVEDLCEVAGVGRSTFYLYFDSKERLLIELALATARGVATDVEMTAPQSTLDDRIAAFIDGLTRRMERTSRSLARNVMRQVSMSNVTARQSANSEILFDDVLSSIVLDAQQRGEVRSDVDAADIGEVTAGMILDALERWAGGDDRRSLRQSLELRLGLLLDAVRVRRAD
jgi:AcrR family transcriptional regulator